MLLYKFSTLFAGLSLVAATSANAQQTATVKLTEPYAPPNQGAVTAFGYYMSPYSGTVDGYTQRLNCVDFFHDVTLGETWQAVQLNLGTAIGNLSLLSSTRDGSNGLFSNLSDVLAVYEKVAWLTDRFPANPATNPDQSIAIQTAIWQFASNSPTQTYASTGDFWATGATDASHPTTYNLASLDVNSTGYWINQANTQYSKYDATYYSRFNILTDKNINNASCQNNASTQYVCTAQEFVYSTPEPGTLMLLATGLMAIVGTTVARRRRQSDVAGAPANAIA